MEYSSTPIGKYIASPKQLPVAPNSATRSGWMLRWKHCVKAGKVVVVQLMISGVTQKYVG